MGILLKNVSRFPKSTGLSINLFIIYISLPALIFNKFPNTLGTINLSGDWWAPILMAWLMFFISWVVISIIGKNRNWSNAKMGALILTCGLGNTSFVGFPLLEALLGKESIGIGILADQPGSFLIVSSLGLFVAAKYSGGDASFKKIMQRIFTFPPFLALLISVFWFWLGIPYADWLMPAFEKISMSLVPLALFGVGFLTDFRWHIIKKRLIPLSLGLILKLFIFPLIFYFLFIKIISINHLYAEVTVLESAMATQITSAVVAAEFNLDTEIANLMVGLTIPISLLTVPLIHKIGF